MTRRDALLRLSALLGGTIFGANRFLSSPAAAADASAAALLSAADLALLDEVGETILPATAGSGGAKAARIGEFMHSIVRDFYDPDERTVFTDGLRMLQAVSRRDFGGREFMALQPEERHALLLALDRAQPPPEYYRMLKQLTVWGYFSSEVGATQALIHVPVPGKFEGCVTVAPDARAWSD